LPGGAPLEVVDDRFSRLRENLVRRLRGVKHNPRNPSGQCRRPPFLLGEDLFDRQLTLPRLDDLRRSDQDQGEIGRRQQPTQEADEPRQRGQAVSHRIDTEVPPTALPDDESSASAHGQDSQHATQEKVEPEIDDKKK
jgi:hypothetical protein